MVRACAYTVTFARLLFAASDSSGLCCAVRAVLDVYKFTGGVSETQERELSDNERVILFQPSH